MGSGANSGDKVFALDEFGQNRAVTGVGVGVLQALVLARHRISGAFWWAIANPPAWALGWLVSSYVISRNIDERFAIFGASGAIVFGLLTWLLLAVLFRAAAWMRDPARAGVNNLLQIYELFSGQSRAAIEAQFAGKGYGALKNEVAEAVIFLLSDKASLFTGQTLNPNSGGYMP